MPPSPGVLRRTHSPKVGRLAGSQPDMTRIPTLRQARRTGSAKPAAMPVTRPPACDGSGSHSATRYTRPRPSTFSDSTLRPNFVFKAPDIAPRTVCDLCRLRHKAHYADFRIMPMWVFAPLFLAGTAAKG